MSSTPRVTAERMLEGHLLNAALIINMTIRLLDSRTEVIDAVMSFIEIVLRQTEPSATASVAQPDVVVVRDGAVHFFLGILRALARSWKNLPFRTD